MKLHTLPSWLDQGHMVHVTDHVTNVLRDIRALSDRIDVYWNEVGEEFDLVERCLDGSQRLIFSTPELDNRVVERLRRADHWHGRDVPTHILSDDEDVIARIDEHNEEVERLQREKTRDQIHAAGEELAWALDIVSDRPSVGGSILVPRSISDG